MNFTSKKVDRGIPDMNDILVMIDQRMSQQTKTPGSIRFLPEYFVPGKWDVICHAGKENHHHIGNMRFRFCINNHLNSYMKAIARSERSAIISNIVATMRKSSRVGGFVRLDILTHRWYEVGDKIARDKVGHALRDAMSESTNCDMKDAGGIRKARSSPACRSSFKKVCSDSDFEKMTARREGIPSVLGLSCGASSLPNMMEARLPWNSPSNLGNAKVESRVEKRNMTAFNADVTIFGRQGLLTDTIKTLQICSTPAAASASAMKMIDRNDIKVLDVQTSKPKSSNQQHSLSLFEWFELDAREGEH